MKIWLLCKLTGRPATHQLSSLGLSFLISTQGSLDGQAGRTARCNSTDGFHPAKLQDGGIGGRQGTREVSRGGWLVTALTWEVGSVARARRRSVSPRLPPLLLLELHGS